MIGHFPSVQTAKHEQMEGELLLGLSTGKEGVLINELNTSHDINELQFTSDRK